MSLRIGRVTAVHPEDHSVDLVMVDDGSRLTGVQVLAVGASSNTGVVNLPEPAATPDKWDLTQRTSRDASAVVGMVGSVWVVVGFLMPQVSQMTFAAGRYVNRLASDVYTSVDGNGNIELHHPSGAYIRLAETPDHEDLAGQNFDGNWALTKNTGRSLHLQVVVGGTTVHITPGGDISIDHPGNLTVNTGGNASLTVAGNASATVSGTTTVTSTGAAAVHAPAVTIDAPTTTCTGALNVNGLLTFSAGMTGSGGSGATVSITGNVATTGTVSNNGVNIGSTHTHDYIDDDGAGHFNPRVTAIPH